jgi:hypothetical protein
MVTTTQITILITNQAQEAVARIVAGMEILKVTQKPLKEAGKTAVEITTATMTTTVHTAVTTMSALIAAADADVVMVAGMAIRKDIQKQLKEVGAAVVAAATITTALTAVTTTIVRTATAPADVIMVTEVGLAIQKDMLKPLKKDGSTVAVAVAADTNGTDTYLFKSRHTHDGFFMLIFFVEIFNISIQEIKKPVFIMTGFL